MSDHPLILTGSISIDRIMNFSGKYQDMIQKDKLHVLSLSVLIDSLTDSPGGTAANIAYNLALLGTSPVLLGAIGKSDNTYLDRLNSLGIDISHVHLSSLPTPTFTVLTDIEDNQVGGFYPGAMTDHDTLTLDPWADQNPLVVISANDPSAMSKYVQYCKNNNLEFVYDVGQQVTNISDDDLKEGVMNCHILMVNDYELGVIEEKLGIKANKTAPIVVTTLGSKGCEITGKEIKNQISVPARADVKVLDPTGAGDAYRGGFLHAYLQGWDLTTCARLGNLTGSFAVGVKGTQEHVFSLNGIKEIYKTVYKGEL